MNLDELRTDLLAYLGIDLKWEDWEMPDMSPRRTLVVRCDPSFADAVERWLTDTDDVFGYRVEQVEAPPF